MTDPTTPLTDESEALLAEVHGTQMALTVFPARLRAIEAAAARRALEGSGVVEALRKLLDAVRTDRSCLCNHATGKRHRPWCPVVKADEALAALPRPEEPRVERCADPAPCCCWPGACAGHLEGRKGHPVGVLCNEPSFHDYGARWPADG